MAEVILMPRLSDTMTEGVIASWHKKIGEMVNKGDVLAEIETDKATMELESYQQGTLLHIGTQNGGKLQVNDLLAILGTPNEDISTLIAQHSGSSNSPKSTTVIQPTKSEEAVSNTPTTSTSNTTTVNIDEAVLMPRLSDTMTEGVIASWHKNIGEPVKM